MRERQSDNAVMAEAETDLAKGWWAHRIPWLWERVVLARSIVHVDTIYGRIPVKVARRDGQLVNMAPEYEACRGAARSHAVALKQVYAAVTAAWQAR